MVTHADPLGRLRDPVPSRTSPSTSVTTGTSSSASAPRRWPSASALGLALPAHRRGHHPLGPQAHGRPRDQREAAAGPLLRRRDREGTLQALSAGLDESGIGTAADPQLPAGAVGLLGLPRRGPPCGASLPGDKLTTRSGVADQDKPMRIVRDGIWTPILASDLGSATWSTASRRALQPERYDIDPTEVRASTCRSTSPRPPDPAAHVARRHQAGQGRQGATAARTGRSTGSSRTPRSAPTGCPISPQRADHPPPALSVPPVHLRPRRLRQVVVIAPPSRCRSCRSPWTSRATWSRRVTSTSRSARASGSVTTMTVGDTGKVATTNGSTPGAHQGAAPARSPTGPTSGFGLGTMPRRTSAGLPRTTVLHARRDRPVELRRPAADRCLPDALVRPEHDRVQYDGVYDPLRGVHMSRRSTRR